jgi:hypothetical protein
MMMLKEELDTSTHLEEATMHLGCSQAPSVPEDTEVLWLLAKDKPESK